MRCTLLALIVAVGLTAGCDELNTQTAKLPDAKTPPDNSGVNARDSDLAKTPIDQNENRADIERTAEIRRKVLEIPDASINARNVKIITQNRIVTLRGPVASQDEKEAVFRIAVEVAGAENVVDELEVPPPKS
jgi:hyperosmotically inducible periplasmic protein